MAPDFAISTAQPAPVACRPSSLRPGEGRTGESGDRKDFTDRTARTARGEPHRFELGEVIAEWSCPVCGTSCDRRYRPGRARVYCTNACRQRAYRWRRDHRSSLAGADDAHRPPPRLRTRDRSHALRSSADLVGDRRDSTGRQITACGSFGRAVRDRPTNTWHTDFVAGTPWSCRTCAQVLGVPEIPVAVMLERALAHAAAARASR